MRIVIALGGNALLQRKEPLEESLQRKNIVTACQLIAQVAKEHEVIITHGNGPQVGLLALQNDAYKAVTPYALDVLGAETQGMIGYLMAQSLKNNLPNKNIITLLTQTLVDQNDPAFQNPTKFVGPVYTEAKAKKLAAEKGWTVRADGDSFRRVVPSPKPKGFVEQSVINELLKLKNIVVICAGGGGVPVMIDENQQLKGLEAVVDKDRASNVLAQAVNADALIILTDVSTVETNFGMPNSKKIKKATPKQMMTYAFASGSMKPKVEAALSFVQSGGQFSAIGSLTELIEIVNGQRGTQIMNNCPDIMFYE